MISFLLGGTNSCTDNNHYRSVSHGRTRGLVNALNFCVSAMFTVIAYDLLQRPIHDHQTFFGILIPWKNRKRSLPGSSERRWIQCARQDINWCCGYLTQDRPVPNTLRQPEHCVTYDLWRSTFLHRLADLGEYLQWEVMYHDEHDPIEDIDSKEIH